jgi:hypothetical protein
MTRRRIGAFCQNLMGCGYTESVVFCRIAQLSRTSLGRVTTALLVLILTRARLAGFVSMNVVLEVSSIRTGP